MLLRLLLYITTTSLGLGMALLRFETAVGGALVVVFTVVVSLLVLEVIDDLDEPFSGVRIISAAPLEKLSFGKRPTDDGPG